MSSEIQDTFAPPARSDIPPHTSSLTRNTVINLLGSASPLAIAFFALPVLTRALGTARFGVLTLTWAVLGYVSLFDLGLGRAITKVVAEKIGRGEEQDIGSLVWNSLGIMIVLGVAGALLVLATAPLLMRHVLQIPAGLEQESLESFYLVGISIPVVTSMAGLRGVLEAKQRFDLVNMLRIPLGAYTLLSPLLVLPFSHSLVPLVAMLLLGRVVAWIAYLRLCYRVIPSLRSPPVIDLSAVRSLVRFGSWITVSNIISPLMVTLDRFVIGAVISVAAVAYYTAPYEAVTKLWLVPGAVTGVLFPAFAAVWVRQDQEVVRLLQQGVKYTFILLFPIVLVIVTLGHEGLTFWLGREYAEHSTEVLQWLAIGVFVNCLGHIPYALIQAVGRPDLTAKLHLLELPFYLAALWWLIGVFGIEGAAVVWAVRLFVDTIALFAVARKLVPARSLGLGWLVLGSLTMLALVVISLLARRLDVRVIVLALTLPTFLIAAWYRILSAEERNRWRTYART